jgi:hypothetical protein
VLYAIVQWRFALDFNHCDSMRCRCVRSCSIRVGRWWRRRAIDLRKELKRAAAVTTVAVARAMKAAGAGEPDVDAMVSQAQRELSRQNAAAPSAELADKYILTDDSASVAISSTQTRGSGRAEYTVFVIDVKRGASSWTVFRRYEQFEELRDKLKRTVPVPGGVPPDFPSKEGNKKDAGVNELRLREYLLALHAHRARWHRLIFEHCSHQHKQNSQLMDINHIDAFGRNDEPL